MSIAKDSVSMGSFTLNERIEDLNSIAGKLKNHFGNLGYRTEISRKDGCLEVLLGKDRLFKTVPGLFSFICVMLHEHSDQCDIALIFAKTNGLETSMIMQMLINSTVIIDPCPIPKLPRYDYMIGSLFHKSAQERNVGFFHTKGYGRQIIDVVNSCL